MQVFLLIAALVSVPTMLFVKPYLLNKRHKQRQANLEQYGRVSRLDSEDEESGTRIQQPQQHGEEHEEFDFAEIFVHQVFCFPSTVPCTRIGLMWFLQQFLDHRADNCHPEPVLELYLWGCSVLKSCCSSSS